jgi:hypothetical protein
VGWDEGANPILGVGWGSPSSGLTTKEVFETLRGNVKVEKHLRYLIIGEKEDHKVDW